MIMILFWLVAFSLVMSYFLRILFITLWGQVAKILITKTNLILIKTYMKNEQNLFNGFSCRYYLEDSFNEKLKSCAFELSQCFSLCHINIRSIKVNLSHFENYLQLLSIDFPVIAITETWLTDITCDLYSLTEYNFVEQHRSNKCGRGVGICFTKSPELHQ